MHFSESLLILYMVYDILYELGLTHNQMSKTSEKKGKKEVKKVKIKKCTWRCHFLYNYLYDTCIIINYIFNLKEISKDSWRSINSKKRSRRVKKSLKRQKWKFKLNFINFRDVIIGHWRSKTGQRKRWAVKRTRQGVIGK